jgi:hypothetical protein
MAGCWSSQYGIFSCSLQKLTPNDPVDLDTSRGVRIHRIEGCLSPSQDGHG